MKLVLFSWIFFGGEKRFAGDEWLLGLSENEEESDDECLFLFIIPHSEHEIVKFTGPPLLLKLDKRLVISGSFWSFLSCFSVVIFFFFLSGFLEALFLSLSLENLVTLSFSRVHSYAEFKGGRSKLFGKVTISLGESWLQLVYSSYHILLDGFRNKLFP